LAVLQVQQAAQAWETLRKGEQTFSFVRSKKVDAVCRSLPSIVLQLYGLMLTLPTLGASGVTTIGLSVIAGTLGSAMTLGSLAPKSGDGIFSFAFAVHLCYFVCELTARLVSMGLLFVSLGPAAFGVLAADFLWKLFWTWVSQKETPTGLSPQQASKKPGMCDILSDMLNRNFTFFFQSLLWFGSDGIDGPGGETAFIVTFYTNEKTESEREKLRTMSIFFVSFGSILTQLISLFLVNLLSTPALLVLRASKGGPVQALTALACVALLLKLLIGFYIHQTTFEQQPAGEGQGQKGTQLGGLSSHDKSSSATSGGPADPIPKRLQASISGSGSLSVGSVKVMHDNPLRLSDAQAPPPPPPPAQAQAQAHAHAHAHRPSDAQVDTHALARSHGHTQAQAQAQASPLHRGSDAV